MVRAGNTLNVISSLFCQATQEVLETSTGEDVSFAKTIQKVPVVHLRPDIGCFVLFNGDYSGLMIMNFSAQSAIKIYRTQMMRMGLPENELSTDYTADDVVDNIGETVNQIIGNVRRKIEDRYGLVASNSQPKSIALTTSIVLTIESQDLERELCRRLSFKIGGDSFHLDLSMEKTEFVSMDGTNVHEEQLSSATEKASDSFDALVKANQDKDEPEVEESKSSNGEIDIEALMKANKM